MKLLLTITSGTLAGRVFELESGFLTVGRSETCSVRFDPAMERIASKQHAFIEAKPDGYYVTDNQSMNGTLLNGNAVQSAKLSSGDTIQFGRNGIVATVSIEDVEVIFGAGNFDPEKSFRDYQIQQFDQIAQKEPVGVQMSLEQVGLGHIAVQPEKSGQGTLYASYVLLGLFLFAAPFMLILVGAILWLSLDPIPALLATVIAFTPAIIYVLPLVWLDRYDPEPLWLLALAFSWGALVAVLVSIVVNTVFGSAIYAGTGSAGLSNVASAVISAPMIEEASKGLGLVFLLVFFRRYFDDILDGIVYGGVIALGFATVENVLYYGNGLNEAYREFGVSPAALMSFLVLFALRGIFSPFAHATFTSMTGIGCGMARESHNTFVKFAAPVLGYIIAVILHAVWNGMGIVALIIFTAFGIESACSTVGLGGENLGLCAFFAGYIILEVPFFLLFVGFTFFIMRRQRRILGEMLALDIARGLIPEEHADIARSAFRSIGWKLNGIFAGKYWARTRYIRAIGKLGLSYWHIQRATAAQGHTGSFQQNPILREEVLKWRDQV